VLITLAALLIALLLVLFVLTRMGAAKIEKSYPPVGKFIEVNGARLHYVHVPAGPKADLPPIIFIHGASANLNDQMIPLRPLLEGRGELLFFDRPGHGWSERGPSNNTQELQAETIAALMDALSIKDAIIVAHSFGGSVAMALALSHPENVRGLVLLAAATHPWPDKKTQWYYDLSMVPVIGRIFTETLSLPAGQARMQAASQGVFCPNPMPAGYVEKAKIPLVLRPSAFRANAEDVAGLYDYTVRASPRYGEIKKPTIIITGDSDTVVLEEVHSKGLARDIAGSELVWIEGLGHKPEYIVPEIAVMAMEKLSGADRDIQAAARVAEARIAAQSNGGCQ
jgi:pimeloyl-ACP methyl ester carboxylesterase